MANLEVHVPIPLYRRQSHPLAARQQVINGLTIGLLDNMKANAGELLVSVAESLQGQDADLNLKLVMASKNATAAAPDAVLNHLKSCDAVILAIAD